MSVFEGKNIRLSIEGGSHTGKMTMSLTGFPAGVRVDFAPVRSMLSRRAPGQAGTTQRKESDLPVFVSGITDGVTDGSEIKAYIENKNADSSAYGSVNRFPRPSHADYPAVVKYGRNTDLRGGGHFSGRLTAMTVTAGALAMSYLNNEYGINIFSHILSLGEIKDSPFDPLSPVPAVPGSYALDPGVDRQIHRRLMELADAGDSQGGVAECAVTGLPVGLGEHIFRGVEGLISSLVFSVPAVKGIDFGAGFDGSAKKGSEYNDGYHIRDGRVETLSNNCGGATGGMTNGMPVIFRVLFKPTPSIALPQKTVDLDTMTDCETVIKGRHDPSVLPRALPVVEASAALAFLDLILDGSSPRTLIDARTRLDVTDAKIMELLSERFELTDAVGRIKKENGLRATDGKREEDILSRADGLKNGGRVKELYGEIFRLSKSSYEK